ncbi:MAG TPA: VOC family protein [Allosphingosinicella sp.]|nr:VOC family protein [Allosphingosinicella sp.]
MILTPYLIVKGAPAALDFYTRAFGAKEELRLTNPTGTIGHAHMTIGDSAFMLADEHPEFGALSPVTLGGSPITLHLTVADPDAAAQRAVDAGATLLRPVQDQFHGNRSGMVADPFGHKWALSAEIEKIDGEEMQRRYAELMAGEEA